MTKLTTVFKTAFITLSVNLFLTACMHPVSDSSIDSPASIIIKGSVGDGPVINSIITVKDANNLTLSSSTSDNQANYQASYPSDTLFPVVISATGGLDTVTNTPPDFIMLSATLNASETNANINPFSTLIVKTAIAMPGGLTTSNLEAARVYVQNKMNFGLDPRLIPDVINTPVTAENVANIIKASETMAEAIRRTRTSLLAAGLDFNEDQIIDFLAKDIADGNIDGLGAGADARIAATFNVTSGQVLIEALSNRLIVNGTLATTALNNAIQLTTPTATTSTADVVITDTMLTQAKTAIKAAQTLPLTATATTELSNLLSILDGIAPDSMASTIDTLLPVTASDSFNQPITTLVTATDSELATINEEANITVATVMVSSNADLSNAVSLSGALLNGNVYIFFQEGSDWNARGVKQVTYYCCKSSTEPHIVYPTNADSSYIINVDLSLFATGTIRELYADVFFNDDSWDNFRVNFTISTINQGNNAPTITGTPSTAIVENSNYNFTPNANDVDGDTLTFSIINKPLWASFNTSTGTLAGTPDSVDAGITNGIIISVSDGIETASLASFDLIVTPIVIGSAALSWIPPLANNDGSVLTDLVGYKIHYGTAAGKYTTTIDVNNIGITNYLIENLTGPNTYYFVMTAYNSAGIESVYSNSASKTIQ